MAADRAILAALAGVLALAGVALAGRPLRDELLAIPLTPQLGGETTRPLEGADAFKLPAANTLRRHQRPFSFGNRLFNTNWVEAPASVESFDGLGPLFNRVSCSGCHTQDGRGQPPADGHGPMDQMLLRLSVAGEALDGGPKPHPVYGGQLSERALPGVAPEGVARIEYTAMPGAYGDGSPYTLQQPSYAIGGWGYGEPGGGLLVSPRVAPHMIGLGLLEAVPDETLLSLADPDDRDGDGISGRVNRVWNSDTATPAIGRFGWKASQPSLRQQNAAAAIGDIGLTTDMFTGENCSPAQSACAAAVTGVAPELAGEFLDKLTLYTRLIAVPAQRNAADPLVGQGEASFRALGCAACHLPALRTQAAALPELADQVIHPFTDLLLHDMGEGLADNRPDFEATGSEWRTPPLWGLGLVPTVNGHDRLLHDRRARGFAEAILWHGGEAKPARDAFRSAPASEREALIAFLKSL